MSVGIVVVSHSRSIAAGVVELAGQMAGDVRFAPAGGTEDGGIGTSFDAITAAIESMADLDGIVVLCDLGSAYLTTDTALEFLDEDLRSRVAVSHAPLVEGTVAAAVAAETGGDREAVLAAAATALDDTRDAGAPDIEAGGDSAESVASEPARGDSVSETDESVVTVPLINPSGLHARPAAEFVKAAASFDSVVRVNDTDAKSLLSIMALALGEGAVLTIRASGPDASAATKALADLVSSGFGEVER